MTVRAATALLAATIVLSGCSGSAGADGLTTGEGEDVTRVAAHQLEQMLSYDASTLDRDVAEVDEVSEGDFARQYRELLGTTAAKRIRRDRAASSAVVVEIGIHDDSGQEPVLLAFVRQTTTSNRLAGPRLDLSALEVAMVRGGDGWRISSIAKVAPIRAKDGAR
jgi:hypothetical protein